MKKNQAVKNNPDKFPEGYILKLDDQEVTDLRSKISTASWGGRRNAPKAKMNPVGFAATAARYEEEEKRKNQ